VWIKIRTREHFTAGSMWQTQQSVTPFNTFMVAVVTGLSFFYCSLANHVLGVFYCLRLDSNPGSLVTPGRSCWLSFAALPSEPFDSYLHAAPSQSCMHFTINSMHQLQRTYLFVQSTCTFQTTLSSTAHNTAPNVLSCLLPSLQSRQASYKWLALPDMEINILIVCILEVLSTSSAAGKLQVDPMNNT
jgi:hypothetical protein